ncbi:FAD-binding domain-containing protein [Lipomyces oligophaga]|uniref:FAD-binding domain-containing protein n=1 Tax=Lipomyces oligophaga TaxID=45792 RepID=UPI0034CEC7B9
MGFFIEKIPTPLSPNRDGPFIKEGTGFSRIFVPTYNAVIGFIFLALTASYFYNLHFKKAHGEKQPLLGASAKAPSKATLTYRRLRSVLLYQPKGRYSESYGTMSVIAGYLGLNILYLFVHNSTRHVTIFGDRLGLLAVVNMPLLFLLGAKTGLLVQWTGWSHEGYNILHRHCGRVVCSAAVLHVFFYSLACPIEVMVHVTTIFVALLATIGFFIILISSIAPLRAKTYEMFLYLHVYLVVAILPLLYFHFERVRPYVITSAVIFVWDRINRFKNAHNVIGRTTILSGNTVKLSLDVHSTAREIHWKAGQYVYVSVSELARQQAHPFTIASPPNPNSLDLIIRARKGFSKSLFLSEASEHKVTFHGPYGSPPSFEGADRVILLAGGAGISYAYPESIELASATGHYAASNPEVDFLWVVPSRDFASWVDLKEDYNVDFKVWVTAEQGRPDIKKYVKDSIIAAGPGARVCVGVCGPAPLVRDSRNACSEMLWEGNNVAFYSENFGW